MAFDYSKLTGRIVEKCKTKGNFAEKMGITDTTISAKLNGKSQFSQTEIIKAADILDIPSSEIPIYFFTPEVQKI